MESNSNGQPVSGGVDFTDVNNGDDVAILADTLTFINHNTMATLSEKLEAAKQAETAFKRIRPYLKQPTPAMTREELVVLLQNTLNDINRHDSKFEAIITALAEAGVLNVRNT